MLTNYSDLPERVNPTEFCAMYGKHRGTVWRHQCSGKLPYYKQFGERPDMRLVGYDRNTLAQIFGIPIPNQPAIKANEAAA